MRKMLLAVAVATLPALVLSACDGLGLGGDKNMTVSFSVPRSGVSASLIADSISVGGHTLNLQNADITFSKIKLDRKESNTSAGSDNEDSDSDDGAEDAAVKFGETTIALPMSGGVITPISSPIPAGDYESIEMLVSSVRVRGTYDGKAFDATVPVHVEIEQRLSPMFHVASDADKLNITITLDPTQWLRTSSGTLIDPAALATNSQLRSQVVSRIRASLKAFEDSNKDAHDGDNDSDRDSR